jgi:POT family proton-dependent oligopeptide transporter
LDRAQEEANTKPHLFGASLNNDNVGANVEIEKQVIEQQHDSHSSAGSGAPRVLDHDEDEIVGVRPTAEELLTLRKVGEPLPKAAFLVAIVELCERFTYYGCQGLFQNYIARPRDGSLGRGALGMGPKGATGLGTFFQFWCYGKLSFGTIP